MTKVDLEFIHRSRHEHEFEAELIQLMKDIEPNYTHKTISRK